MNEATRERMHRRLILSSVSDSIWFISFKPSVETLGYYQNRKRRGSPYHAIASRRPGAGCENPARDTRATTAAVAASLCEAWRRPHGGGYSGQHGTTRR